MPLSSLTGWDLIFGTVGQSSAGVRVTTETALASVAVLSCVLIRAETIGALPAGVYRKDGRRRTPLPNDPRNLLLFEAPNDWMTGAELWRWVSTRRDLAGNSFVRVRDWDRVNPSALVPLSGQNPVPVFDRTKGKLWWDYGGDEFNEARAYSPAELLHFKGPIMANPYMAKSPVMQIRDTVGLSIASEEFFGRFLANGSHFPNYFETDAALSDEDRAAFGKQFKDGAGVLPAGKLRLFDRGLKLRTNSMSLKDADLTGHMRWQLEQVCRVYRMPLPMVQDWTHGTYTNSEQAGLWFGQHTITPPVTDQEAVLKRRLFPGAPEYAKWSVDGLLRGDYQTRTAGYSILINCGVMAPNEARALEDMDPYDGGDAYRVPLNTAPAGSPEATTPPDPVAAARDALYPVLVDVADRIRTRAAQDFDRGRGLDVTRGWALETVLPSVQKAFAIAEVPQDWAVFVDECVRGRGPSL